MKMASDHDSISKVAERDKLDYELESLKDQGLVDSSSFISNPKQERQIDLLKKKLQDNEETIANLKKQVQHYKDKIEQRLLKGYPSGDETTKKDSKGKSKTVKPLTEQELKEELKKLQDSEELDILKKKLAEETEIRKKQETELHTLKNEFDSYRENQEEILTDYQADTALQRKLKEIQVISKRYDLINEKMVKAESRYLRIQDTIQKDMSFYNETLVLRFNAKVEELRVLEKKIQSRRNELGQFAKLKLLPKDESKPQAEIASSRESILQSIKNSLGGILQRR